jgi:predicted outer membrane repeat protein
MKMLTIPFFLFLLSNTFPLFGQTTRQVPSQYPTIQAGLNAAQNGDTVLVQPGIYQENIIWPSTSGIKLIGKSNQENVVIDGRKLSTVIYVQQSTDTSSELSNISIINGGNVDFGGGVFVNNRSLSLKNMTIRNNSALNSGGAIYFSGAHFRLSIEGLTIIDNVASQYGGGIYISQAGKLSVSNSSFTSNVASVGASIASEYVVSLIIDKSEFINNISNSDCGGVYLNSTAVARITNTKFLGNNATVGRGGLFVVSVQGILSSME